jgi:hypothetical protein
MISGREELPLVRQHSVGMSSARPFRTDQRELVPTELGDGADAASVFRAQRRQPFKLLTANYSLFTTYTCLFRGLSQRRNEPIHILITDKLGDRVVQRLLERSRCRFAMNAARHQGILRERSH